MIITRGLGSWSILTRGYSFFGSIITALHEVAKFCVSITNRIRLKVRV